MEPVKEDRPPGGGESAVESGAASQPFSGESSIGDRHLVQHFRGGVLIAAVDGLGHGSEAASAAQLAISILEQSPDEPVEQLVGRCHERLRGTRGVVMSLASLKLSDGLMSWLGIGNVEAVALRPRENDDGPAEEVGTMIACPGIVGYKLPTLRSHSIRMRRGDLAILATDGVRPGFGEGLHPLGTAQRIAEGILERHGKGTDDALVVVVRLVGGPV